MKNYRVGTGTTYEDYDAMIRRKFEQQEMSRCARISRKYPGMSYEEIASTRSASVKRSEPKKIEEVDSPDKESVESVELPRQENNPTPLAPDPFDKLNSKVGKNTFFLVKNIQSRGRGLWLKQPTVFLPLSHIALFFFLILEAFIFQSSLLSHVSKILTLLVLILFSIFNAYFTKARAPNRYQTVVFRLGKSICRYQCEICV